MTMVKDGAGKLSVQWSIERVAHENGSITMEPAVHITSGSRTLVSVKVSSVSMLVKELLSGAAAANKRLDEIGDRPAGESSSFGVRVEVPHERPGRSTTKDKE
jgi:hypothetical protein